MKRIERLLPSLEKYRISTKRVIKLYSSVETRGMYLIDQKKAYKLIEPAEEDNATIIYNGHSLFLQNNDFIKEEITSQLPVNCACHHEVTFTYSNLILTNVNKEDTKVLLRVEGVEGIASKSDVGKFVPTNFYFETTNNSCEGASNNQQFQNELNGLLSLLK